jgi:hypothetical protein
MNSSQCWCFPVRQVQCVSRGHFLYNSVVYYFYTLCVSHLLFNTGNTTVTEEFKFFLLQKNSGSSCCRIIQVLLVTEEFKFFLLQKNSSSSCCRRDQVILLTEEFKFFLLQKNSSSSYYRWGQVLLVKEEV